MYSQELENLISTAIVNGILEDKDREALFKCAQAEGIDLNKFEIYLNSEVKKRRRAWFEEAKARNLAKYEARKRGNDESAMADDPIQSKVQSIIDEALSANLYPKEILLLLKEYLSDGILTDKERQVILRKAEDMGIDRDELDLYLDSQVQKIEQITEAVARRQKGKSCPFCGAAVPQLTDKCPEYGQHITPEATKELEEILDNLEEALVNMKSRKDFDRNKAIVERYGRKSRMYYSNHPKIKALLAEVDDEMNVAESKLKSIERKETLVSILKNKWLWKGMPFLLTLIFFVKCQSVPDGPERDPYTLLIILCVFIGIGILFFELIKNADKK
jgi:hypothetical protein